MISAMNVATAGCLTFWGFLTYNNLDEHDNKRYNKKHLKWFFGYITFFFVIFTIQCITVYLLLKSYITIKHAASILGLQSKSQTN